MTLSAPSLDQLERHQLQQVDRRQGYFWALNMVLLGLIPVVILFPLFVKIDLSLWWLLCYPPILIWRAWRYGQAAHANFGYILLDDGLWLRKGVYWRSYTFVPRIRIQHTEVKHGPIDRRLGLAKLVVFTAGVRLGHLSIPGLTEAAAHALRDDLLARAATTPEQFIAGQA